MNSTQQNTLSELTDLFSRDTLADAPFGYICSRVILDERGIAQDFEVIEANHGFEDLTGLEKENLAGRNASEIFPKEALNFAKWLQLYGEATKRESHQEIEQYSGKTQKWFRIQAYSPRAPFVITLLFDITEKKISQLALQTKADALGRRVKGMTLLLYLSKMTHNESTVSDLLQEAVRLIPSVWKNPDQTSVRITYNGEEFCSRHFEKKGLELRCDIRVFEETAGSIEVFSLENQTPIEIDEEYELLYFLTGLLGSAIENIESQIASRNNEATLRLYMDHAPDGITVVDRSGQYKEVNEPACKMLGYSKEELLQLSVQELIPPKMNSADLFDELIQKGSQEGNLVLLRKDGSHLPAMVSSVKLPNGDYMAFFRDISDRQRTEMEKALYYNAIQSVSQPMVITDTQGEILELNRAFSEMYGYSKEEVIGKDPKVLNPGKKVYNNLGYTEREYNELFKSLWHCIRNPEIGTWEDVIVNKRKDGSLMWVRLLINAVFDENQEVKNFIGLPIDISNIREKEKVSRVQLYRTMADLAELRDNETGYHMRRVGIFSKLLAKSLEMPEKYCEDIEIFTPMHDIGKVGILDSILLAERRLTNEEFQEMKKHTLLGHNIVKGNKELELVALITLHHHERFDGKGYPHNLKGEDIPLSARITAIADVYDALRSKRPYKEEWSHERAREEIAKNAGTQFDPLLVRSFLSLDRQFKEAYEELRD
ncbi:MAG: PAS domain S-box protein [Chitinispirillaceae bacterium]